MVPNVLEKRGGGTGNEQYKQNSLKKSIRNSLIIDRKKFEILLILSQKQNLYKILGNGKVCSNQKNVNYYKRMR